MKTQSYKKYIYAAPILLALAGLAYYFLYFIKTPAYAVNEIRSAIEQRDTTKFQQYVALDNLLDKAFEDLIQAESQINNNNIINNPIALGVLHMLKPNVVSLMKEQALEYIASPKDASAKEVKDPVSDAMRRNLERRAQLNKLRYKGIKLSQEAVDKAQVTLILYNTDLDKDFAVNLSMTKNDTSWQVQEITNLIAIIMQMDAAEKAKLASENKQVLERLQNQLSIVNKSLRITKLRADELWDKLAHESNAGGVHIPDKKELVNKEALEPCLSSNITFKNIANKTILRVYYSIGILNKNKETVYSYPEHFNGSIAPGSEQEVIAIKKLNMQLPEDKALAAKAGETPDFDVTVTYIAFEDGSIIAPNQFFNF